MLMSAMVRIFSFGERWNVPITFHFMKIFLLIIQLLQCSLVSSFTCRWYTSPTHLPHNHPTPIPYQPYTHPTSRTSEVKLVYAGILTSNFFVIEIIVKSRHHIDLQSIQTAPWNE